MCFLLIQTTSPDVDQLYPLTYAMHVVNSSTLHNIKVRETKTPREAQNSLDTVLWFSIFLHLHCLKSLLFHLLMHMHWGMSQWVNPLTPMLALTGRDKPWPFFHFWRHHFWPKLASSILSFCRRKQSLQRCPDMSDPSNAPEICISHRQPKLTTCDCRLWEVL